MKTIMQTRSGRYFDLANPDPESIHIGDIAHALSNICRYNGHTICHYSVAQHSVMCAELVDEEFAFEALMHDAHEAFIGDITRPVRQALGPEFFAMEDRVWRAVAERFDLPIETSPEVKRVDDQALLIERRHLLVEQDWAWPGVDSYVEIPEVDMTPMTPEKAGDRFLAHFHQLCREGRVPT